ncbi:hypothetical protein, partial [Tritonibacter sp. SIMBA_163]|uniref:hypothetical protein n=1 Tax=Tritonibacter sp. SIMBA_163 TaxID=3080868 RepID=UPI00397F2450
DHFKFEVFIVCTATGTMGNVAVHDIVDRVAGVEQDATKADVTINTTTSQTLQLSAEWDTADAANTTTLELMLVEVVNV